VPPFGGDTIRFRVVTIGVNNCFTIFLASFIKSDNDDCMVHTIGAAVIFWLDHSSLVKLKCLGSRIDSGCDWLLLDDVLHMSHGAHLSPVADIAINIAHIVYAIRLVARSSRHIWIVIFEYHAVVFLELPSVPHPRTTAAPSIIILRRKIVVGTVELLPTVFLTQRAVNYLLL